MFPKLVRAALLVAGLLCLAAGAVGLLLHLPTFGPLLLGVLLLVGAVFERWRYKPLEPTPGEGFQPTDERFLDPTSGTPVRVYADPRTGERRYVEDAGP